MTFPGLAHRMETIGVIDGIRFVNDSKATNTDAARQAMSAYSRFHWIAGGRPKSGIDCLSDLFGSVAKAYLIGEAAEDFARTLEPGTPVVRSGTIQAAVRSAFEDARAEVGGGVVLFSPACASFDQFTDFEARGEAFRAAVHNLASETVSGVQA
jgi:UDP-N-acetylmuramoylalanine--D-glutamate ligase